jgi:hypothetical protein
MSVTTIAKTKTPPKNSISQSDDVGLTFLMSLFPSNTFILAVVAAQFNTGSLVFLSWHCSLEGSRFGTPWHELPIETATLV